MMDAMTSEISTPGTRGRLPKAKSRFSVRAAKEVDSAAIVEVYVAQYTSMSAFSSFAAGIASSGVRKSSHGFARETI